MHECRLNLLLSQVFVPLEGHLPVSEGSAWEPQPAARPRYGSDLPRSLWTCSQTRRPGPSPLKMPSWRQIFLIILTFSRDLSGSFQVHLVAHQDPGPPVLAGLHGEVLQYLLRLQEAVPVNDGVDHHASLWLVSWKDVLNLKVLTIKLCCHLTLVSTIMLFASLWSKGKQVSYTQIYKSPYSPPTPDIFYIK